MTTLQPVELDERAVTVANASYRWAYLAQAFALLAVIAYRSVPRQEEGWDLFAIIFLGAAVATGYQMVYRTLGRRWLGLAAVTAVCAAATAMVVALLVFK